MVKPPLKKRAEDSRNADPPTAEMAFAPTYLRAKKLRIRSSDFKRLADTLESVTRQKDSS
jgi:hypothetical protein